MNSCSWPQGKFLLSTMFFFFERRDLSQILVHVSYGRRTGRCPRYWDGPRHVRARDVQVYRLPPLPS